MANDCIPFKEPGSAFTGFTTAAVTGKRFVKLTGDRTGGGGSGAAGSLVGTAGLSNDIHNLYRIGQCTVAGEGALGVSKRDAAIETVLGFHAVRHGLVVPITAGAAINFNDDVMTDSEGRAIPVSEALSATKASAILIPNAGAELRLRTVALTAGREGNSISVELVNDGTKSKTLTVTTSGDQIRVVLGTGTLAETTSTIAEVIAAINAEAAAAALVTADNGTTGKTTGAATAVPVAKTNLTGGVSSTGKALGLCLTSVASGKDAEILVF